VLEVVTTNTKSGETGEPPTYLASREPTLLPLMRRAVGLKP